MSQAPVAFNGSVLSALDQFNEDFASSRAATGAPTRPPTGDWDNIVKSIEVSCDSDTTIRIKGGNGAPDAEIPGLRVLFTYQVLGGASPVPPKMQKDQVWPGRAFLLPAQGLKNLPASISSGRRQNFQIQLERLKGHLQTILGPANTPPALGAALTLATQKVANSPVICRIGCKVEADEKDPSKSYFEEFLKEALTA